MMKIILILSFIVLCLCQTTININNGKEGCGHTSTGAGCEKRGSNYHVMSTYQNIGGYYDNALITDIWDEVLRRNPDFNKYVTPVPYLTATQHKEIAKGCIQDIVIGRILPTPFSEPQYKQIIVFPNFYNSNGFSGFSNLPKDQNQTTNICSGLSPVCGSLGFCKQGNPADVLALSATNNATIYFHYQINDDPVLAYQNDYVLGVVQTFLDAGASDNNFQVVKYNFTTSAYLELLRNISTIPYTQEIHITLNPYDDSEYCQNFTDTVDSLTNLSDVGWPFKAYGYRSFHVCPTNLQLIHSLEKTVADMTSDGSLCKILKKNLGAVLCRDASLLPVLGANPQYDNCGVPICPAKKSTDRFDFNSFMFLNTEF